MQGVPTGSSKLWYVSWQAAGCGLECQVTKGSAGCTCGHRIVNLDLGSWKRFITGSWVFIQMLIQKSIQHHLDIQMLIQKSIQANILTCPSFQLFPQLPRHSTGLRASPTGPECGLDSTPHHVTAPFSSCTPLVWSVGSGFLVRWICFFGPFGSGFVA